MISASCSGSFACNISSAHNNNNSNDNDMPHHDTGSNNLTARNPNEVTNRIKSQSPIMQDKNMSATDDIKDDRRMMLNIHWQPPTTAKSFTLSFDTQDCAKPLMLTLA